jgi:pyruvate/oxaloacetate carboxyltransferase
MIRKLFQNAVRRRAHLIKTYTRLCQRGDPVVHDFVSTLSVREYIDVLRAFHSINLIRRLREVCSDVR